MQNDPLSHGLWELSAPPAPPMPALAGAAQTEVAIIGAGYTGLSAALHLAEAGVSVTILEAVEAGFGGAGRNVGLVNAGMWVMPEELPRVLGPDYGHRLLAFLGDAPAEVFGLVARLGIDCQAHHNGTLHLATDAKGLAEITAREAQWRAAGAPVERLDAAATARRLGQDRGAKAYRGALLDHRAGTIQPLAYARGLAQAAIATGAKIHGNSPVSTVRRDAGDWLLSTPTGASLRAKWLLPASDAYTTQVFAEIAQAQVILPYFNLSTPPLPVSLRDTLLPGREGCWDTDEVLSSFRMDDAGRMVFGSVGQLGGLAEASHRAWAGRALRRVFPQLAGIDFETGWWGRIGMTPDALPRLYVLGENALTFSGYNGRGIAPGTVFGKALARHVLGELPLEAMPLPVSQPVAARWREAKSAWYAAGAGLVHLVSDRF